MKNLLLTLAIGLTSLCTIFAQSNITGKVLDHENNPVAFANVILNLAADSTMVKVESTDESGFFTIPQVEENKYWLQISYVGLADYNSEIFELENEDFDFSTIQMQIVSNELNEITVTASRPILEIKPDKVIFNVEGSINASGSDGLSLLKKAPGVIVDNNDNISLAGKNGVEIFINGKPSPLSGDDLAAYLRNLSSEDIDNIEIITNPSAKYEAEGNAGIINIKMKKDQRLGANGRINAGYSQGHLPGFNGGLSGNFKSNKINVFGRYSGGEYQGFNNFNLYRIQGNAIYDQRSERDFTRKRQGYNFGMDFFLNEKNTLGVLANGSHGIRGTSSLSKTYISGVNSEEVDSVLVSETNDETDWDNISLNLNYQLRMENNKNLNMDLDYGLYKNRGDEYQPNLYKNETESIILSENIYSNYMDTDINIGTYKLDYNQELWKGELGLGIKSALVITDNLFRVNDVVDGQEYLDEMRSRAFEYTENVNAIYASYGKQIDKFSFQLGLRMEHTFSKGELMAKEITENDLVKRNYVDLFPSLGLTYQLNEKNNFQLNYSRRLKRPNYENLNPFESRLDELVFERGNPFLNPEYSNNIKFGYTFNSRLNTSLSYSKTKDMISEIIVQVDDKIYNSSLNVASQDNWNLNVSAPFPIAKWWNTYTDLSGSYQKNSTTILETNEKEELEVYSFNAYMQNNFDLPWGLKLEVSGWYASPSVYGGFLRTKQMFGVDAGIQKSFLKGNAKLKIGLDDIFYSQKWRGENNYGNDYARADGVNDSRRLKINFSYAFGNQKVKSRRRSTGSEAESGRVGN